MLTCTITHGYQCRAGRICSDTEFMFLHCCNSNSVNECDLLSSEEVGLQKKNQTTICEAVRKQFLQGHGWPVDVCNIVLSFHTQTDTSHPHCI